MTVQDTGGMTPPLTQGLRKDSASRPSIGPRPAAGLRVLLAEDHDFQRRALVHQVRSLGAVDVLEAADGAEALQILKAEEYAIDLVLCDLDMPVMDGMEFLRHLGATGAAIPVIISSAHESKVINSVQIMAQAYGIELLGIIEKPATIKALETIFEAASVNQALYRTQGLSLSPQFELEEILDGVAERQFEPFFQPKADLRTGRIVGAEALARWRHPEHGIIAPFAFIEPLETSGNLNGLTFLMLREASAACRHWLDRGLDLSVSVNLSLRSLEDTGLADEIVSAVTGVGLTPNRVTLEITESAAMTEVAPALENLARLRLRGFGLSIDDFGTGFSSIQQLGRIAFTELKIDKTFVSRMIDKGEARAIVESSVDMAHRLNISTVAEGIETQAEWNAVRAAGCDIAQGYFISRPVEGLDFIDLCERAAR